MPYKTDILTISNEFLDRRVKLLSCQKERIFDMHHRDGYTMRGLGRMFHVDKKLIKFICYPEALEKNKAEFAERQKDGRYYSRLTHNRQMKEHRQYKYGLLKGTV